MITLTIKVEVEDRGTLRRAAIDAGLPDDEADDDRSCVVAAIVGMEPSRLERHAGVSILQALASEEVIK